MDDAETPEAPHPAGRTPHRYHPSVLAVVMAGGLLGTLARYGLSLAWPTGAGHFPLATFIVNTTGAFVLALLLTVLAQHPRPGHHLRPFAATGVLGGWTTYSALAVEGVTLAKDGHLAVAGGYLGATVAAGAVAVTLGMLAGRVGTTRAAWAAAGWGPIDPDTPEPPS